MNQDPTPPVPVRVERAVEVAAVSDPSERVRVDRECNHGRVRRDGNARQGASATAVASVQSPERDRARGALLGLACGDAVGTTVEFLPPGTFPLVTDMVGGGPFHLLAGQWTDDTSMALCLAESIIDTRTLDLADQLRRYLLWSRDGYLSSNGSCFDIGGTTSWQLGRFERTGEPVDPSPDPESAANGSLMRLAPVPIAWHRDLERATDQSGESSRSTHAAQRPVDCCRLMGAMIAALIAGRPAEEVFAPTFWQWGDLHPQVAAIADGSFRLKEPPQIRGTGFCINALEAALWAVAGAHDFEDAVLRAVNLGDDADTTAAIAGQLAGACWGASGIPVGWLAKVAMGDRIVSLADTLFDLEAERESADATWRHDDSVHAWWVKPGTVLAGEYPTNRTGDADKLELLLDAGIRTFIDLTTPADGLTSYKEQLEVMAERRGLTVRHESRPIPDQSTTALDEYVATVELIRSEVAAGRPAYVHCWGGVGRTATVIGCLLAEETSSMASVLEKIGSLRAGTRKAPRRAPENDRQDQVIAAYIERWTHG